MYYSHETQGRLTSSSAYSQKSFLGSRRLFLDSTALIEWARSPTVNATFLKIQKEYSLLVSTVSILEVGFGTRAKASANEVERVRSIYLMAIKEPVDSFRLHQLDAQKQRAPAISAYNPTPNEWYAARSNLLKLLQSRKRDMKATLKLANDAVIWGCSWNSRAPLITENLKDFVLLNSMQHTGPNAELRHMPIFTISDLARALGGDVVSYPENLPATIREQFGLNRNVI
jgi:predicted nucleic acid-binding protein